MWKPLDINKNYILVRVNLKAQKDKRERSGKIHIPPGMMHMNLNQQMGEVLMVGENVHTILEEIAVGDTAIFSHVIEGEAYKTTEYEIPKEIHNDPEWAYYAVRCLHYSYDEDGTRQTNVGFLYAVIKPDGALYMSNFYTFAIASPEEQDNRGMKRIGALYVFNSFKEERKEIEDRLQKMKMEAETHRNRAPQLEKEMEALTRSLSKKRSATFLPIFTPKSLRQSLNNAQLDTTWILYYLVLGVKGTPPMVTQVTLQDKTFYVLRNDYVLMAKKMSEKTLRRLSGEQVDEITEEEIKQEFKTFDQKKTEVLIEKTLAKGEELPQINPYLL